MWCGHEGKDLCKRFGRGVKVKMADPFLDIAILEYASGIPDLSV
jgi:hypothetical protein